MNAPIRNRSGSDQLPKDGWFQIEVSGEHDAGEWPDGSPRKQLVDAAALSAILNRFQQEKAEAGSNFAGILVDRDHLSHDLENDTEAMAWLQDLRIKDGELEGKLDLSDLGETAIRNRRYKFFSTEYEPEDLEDLGDGRVRPLRLSGLAFTNRPRKTGGRPILNRTGDEKPGGNPKQTQQPPMKSIAESLGLPADADEAAILTKITELKSKVDTLETKDAETQAEAIMNRMGDRVPEAARASWKSKLIKNRKETEELMEVTFPANGGQTRIFNRKGAPNPAPVEGREQVDEGEDPEARKQAAAIRNRANTISKQEGIPFGLAFQRAQAELR